MAFSLKFDRYNNFFLVGLVGLNNFGSKIPCVLCTMYHCMYLVYQIEQPIFESVNPDFPFQQPLYKMNSKFVVESSEHVNSKMKIRNIPSAHVIFFYNQNQDRRNRGAREPQFWQILSITLLKVNKCHNTFFCL